MERRKKSQISLFLSLLLFFVTLSCYSNVYADDERSKDANDGSYNYILNTGKENAYVLFGDEIEERYCMFYDGIAMGITEKTDPLYNEKVELDGLTARKQYSGNFVYLKVAEEFYEPGDEFVISIAFYDFGPSEGRYYLEYYNSENELMSVTLVKPGTNPGWAVKTVYIKDADFSKTFDNGANVRLVNGAYNAFKKVEFLNISKSKRENTAPDITCIGSEKRTKLQQINLLSCFDDEQTQERNLYKNCTYEAAFQLLQCITGETGEPYSENNSEDFLSKAALLQMYMKALNILGGDNAIEAASSAELIAEDDLFFYNNEMPATYFNLFSVAYNTLYYKSDTQATFVEKLIEDGYFDDINISTVSDENFLEAYYSIPRECPYVTITDNETGRVYKYMNVFGSPTLRPYLTQQQWTADGKQFICATDNGLMYLYNVETQMLVYVDRVIASTMQEAVIGTDNCIYYGKNDNSAAIWKADINTLETEKVFEFPQGVSFYNLFVSNDCNYMTFTMTGDTSIYAEADETIIARYCVAENELEIYTHQFDYSNRIAHQMVNPEYPELVFFAHETITTETSYDRTYDRVWVLNCETGEKTNIYKQGRHMDGTAIQTATHETWSQDGEHLYLVTRTTGNDPGKTPCVVRVDKDGSHRQYFYNNEITKWRLNHTFVSGDEKFIVADGGYVVLMSTETNQIFPIYHNDYDIGSQNHPYHPHAMIAPNSYMMSWGMVHDGVLGVAWMDFSNIVENEVAKGGRYPLNEMLTRISYQGLECETVESRKNEKDCVYIKSGNALYLDINEQLIDSANASVKISFDYLDNGKQPLILTYTSGVNSDNDAWKTQNAEKTITREGQNTWKHIEIMIESGNFENIGYYSSDMKLEGLNSSAYIANICVERID